MDKPSDKLDSWLRSLSDFSLPEYNSLPEMDLYMDQVISYLDKKLEPLETSSLDPQITPFMVNNYVKANLIAAPNLKKYSREQIGYLFAVCSVKQILSMSDIKMLFETDKVIYPEKDKLYSFFHDVHSEITKSVDKQVSLRYSVIKKRYEEDLENGVSDAEATYRANLAYIAFKLAIEAQVSKTIADRFIQEIGTSFQLEKGQKAEAAAEKARQEAENNKSKKKK